MMISLLAAAAAALCLSHAIASHANVTTFRVLARCTSGADQRDGGTSTLPNCLRTVRSTLRWCWWKWAIFWYISGVTKGRGKVLSGEYSQSLTRSTRALALWRAHAPTPAHQFTPVHSSSLEFARVHSSSFGFELE